MAVLPMTRVTANKQATSLYSGEPSLRAGSYAYERGVGVGYGPVVGADRTAPHPVRLQNNKSGGALCQARRAPSVRPNVS